MLPLTLYYVLTKKLRKKALQVESSDKKPDVIMVTLHRSPDGTYSIIYESGVLLEISQKTIAKFELPRLVLN